MAAERRLSPAVVITGPESVLVERSAADALARIRRGQPGREVKECVCGRRSESANGLSMAEEIVQASAPSLFGDPPILVVRDVDQADEPTQQAVKLALAELDGPPMVVTHNGAARGRGVINAATAAGVEVVKCARPSERDVRAIMRKEASVRGGSLTPGAEHWLVEAVGTQSFAQLLGATRQAVVDSPDGHVDEELVQSLFPAQAKVSSFQVADHVWAGRSVEATRLLRVMEQREKGVGVAVVAALAHGVRMMALVGMRGAEPPPHMTVAPWQRDRARENARRWGATGARIAALAAALPDLDADMKGGLDGGLALDDEQKMAIIESVVARLAAPRDDRAP